jgi:hypothetical protein
VEFYFVGVAITGFLFWVYVRFTMSQNVNKDITIISFIVSPEFVCVWQNAITGTV